MPHINFELESYIQSRSDRLATATTFEQLAVIALGEIALLPQPVGIVCGPLTSGGRGSLEQNMTEFRWWIGQLREEGKIIFNQMPYEPRMQQIKKTPYYDSTRDHLLEVFYGTVFESGSIHDWYFIPGWQDSYGARWERNLVERLNGHVVDLPNRQH